MVLIIIILQATASNMYAFNRGLKQVIKLVINWSKCSKTCSKSTDSGGKPRYLTKCLTEFMEFFGGKTVVPNDHPLSQVSSSVVTDKWKFTATYFCARPDLADDTLCTGHQFSFRFLL